MDSIISKLISFFIKTIVEQGHLGSEGENFLKAFQASLYPTQSRPRTLTTW